MMSRDATDALHSSLRSRHLPDADDQLRHLPVLEEQQRPHIPPSPSRDPARRRLRSDSQHRRAEQRHSLINTVFLCLIAVLLLIAILQRWPSPSLPAFTDTRSLEQMHSDFLHSAFGASPFSKNQHHPITSVHVDNDRTVDYRHQPGIGIQLFPFDHAFRGPRYSFYRWKITAGDQRPDGVKKRVYLINNKFPGPTIEARQGDILTIEVTNGLKGENVSIHWHGLHQAGYQRMDGAAGITQDPIRPGYRMTYRFQLSYDQSGTFWYHAHDELQRGDGLYGGLIIHQQGGDPANTHGFGDFVHEQLLMIGDWYHRPSRKVMDWYWSVDSFGNEPVPDSVLINGRGAYDCAKAVPARPVNCRQVAAADAPTIHISRPGNYRFRLINVGNLAGYTLAFGDNNVTVVTIDGGNAVNTTYSKGNAVGVLHPGERADVLVQWIANDSSINLTIDESSFRYPNPALTTEISVPMSHTYEMEIEPSSDSLLRLVDLSNLTSRRGSLRPPRGRPDQYILLYVNNEKLAHLGNVPTSFINHTSWRPQSPPLLDLTRAEYNADQFVPYIHSPARDPKWVDIVINNLDDGPHPFHLHGYHFFVLGRSAGSSYWGSWNPYVDSKPPGGPLNYEDPPRKDTVLVPSHGYVVLRFKADNYGVWLLHCHVLWHLAGGMGMAIEVGKGAVKGVEALPRPGASGGEEENVANNGGG